MISLTKLNEFKSKVSKIAVSGADIVQATKIAKIKFVTTTMYEEYSEYMGEGVYQVEEQLLDLMKKSIDVVLGKKNEPTKKNPKGKASSDVRVPE